MKSTSTTGSVLGLVAGLVLGSALQGVTHPVATGSADFVGAAGALWVRCLQMVVLPLVIAQLMVTVIACGSGKMLGRMVAAAVVLFVALLAAAAVFTVSVTPPLLDFLSLDADTVAKLETTIPQSARDAAKVPARPETFRDWLVGLVPANPLRAMVQGELLQVMVFTLLFGLAVTRIAADGRDRVHDLFASLADAMFVLVGWLLWLTPAGVFAVALTFMREAGLGVAGILLQFVVLLSGLLIAFTVVLYPIAILGSGLLGARVSPRAFAQSLSTAQIVALSTRSSLAALPALLDGANRHLTLPQETSSFALSFSASAFKVNRTISGPMTLLFLAHLYGIPLPATQILTFVLTVIILSFSSPGIPGGGDTFKTLPAYLAAGLPIEGVVLVKVVDVIPDIFKTLVNVTGYMTVAVLLGNLVRKQSPASASAAADPKSALALEKGAGA